MNILKKFLELFKDHKGEKVESYNRNYRTDPSDHNSNSLEEIELLLSSIVRDATKIEVQTTGEPPENSQLLSHFGGDPYFEEGEEWPMSQNGRHMDFVFQIFNTGDLAIPKSIKLIQLFYDYEEFPWDTKDDGWHVKIFESLNLD
jgi:uncharacterized protein YwqG